MVCGAVLLGWSLVEGYAQLWSLGLPITLGGQALLLVALITQLERIWSEGRRTSTKIDEVDERIAELRQSTKMLSVSHGSASPAFYAHMAAHARRQLPPADLHGQPLIVARPIATLAWQPFSHPLRRIPPCRLCRPHLAGTAAGFDSRARADAERFDVLARDL